MTDNTAIRPAWQDVARARGISLRKLGVLLDKSHTTMLAYSCGKRRVPEDVMERMTRLFGEDVR